MSGGGQEPWAGGAGGPLTTRTMAAGAPSGEGRRRFGGTVCMPMCRGAAGKNDGWAVFHHGTDADGRLQQNSDDPGLVKNPHRSQFSVVRHRSNLRLGQWQWAQGGPVAERQV